MIHDSPGLEQLRYSVDTCTPVLPDHMNRTEVVTLMLAMELRGMAGVMRMVQGITISNKESDALAQRYQSLSDQLIEGVNGKQKFQALIEHLANMVDNG